MDFRYTLINTRYRNTADEPQAGPRSVTFRVYDDDLISDPVNTTISILFVNDPPRVIINDTQSSLVYSEGSGDLIIAATALVQDADNANLTQLILRLTIQENTRYVPLQFSSSEYLTHPLLGHTVNGITIQPGYNGTLQFSGVSSLLAYQTILRGAVYFRDEEIPINNSTERRVSYFMIILFDTLFTGCVYRWNSLLMMELI